MDEEQEPKRQLETAKGGSGRKGKTAIGAGEGGGFDSSQPWSAPNPPPSENQLRAVLCDRSEIIRAGWKIMIHPVATAVGEASDGRYGIEMIQKLKPDLIIVDVDIDVMNGLEVCQSARSASPPPWVVVATDLYHATKYFNQLYRAGAMAICLKSSGKAVLLEATRQVQIGSRYVDPKILELVQQKPALEPEFTLSEREVEVLIRLDLRNKESADELDMKLRTVEQHIEYILRTLSVPTRTAAAVKAVQNGFKLLPVMSERDQTGTTTEQKLAEQHARDAIEQWRQGTGQP